MKKKANRIKEENTNLGGKQVDVRVLAHVLQNLMGEGGEGGRDQ
jgi:hypothetical protein